MASGFLACLLCLLDAGAGDMAVVVTASDDRLEGEIELAINPFERVVVCCACHWMGFYGQMNPDPVGLSRCPMCRSGDWVLVVSEGTTTLQ